MSEEEKKAIELFNSYINAIDTFGTIDYKCINNLYEPAKTILNLVKKQQEEIEKKDKIIYEMAKKLFEHRNDFEWWEIGTDIDTIEEQKQYYENKVEGSK